MTDRTDPFEELAALFLTEPDVATPRQPAAAPTLELIVVGSLPVRASLWLVPYADTVARESGPTALVRLDEEQPTIQLLRTPRGPYVLAIERVRLTIPALAAE